MNIITTTQMLKQFCKHASSKNFITIDTEFIREKTYYSQLCLIQMATEQQAVIVDPLSPNIDLTPLYDLMKNNSVEKVFHASKQDLEIFYFAMGCLPTPIFDTQVAGMVLGYGDQIGYENLVNKVLNRSVDKGARLTDWSKRPLSDKQLNYAIGDVAHLLDIYKIFKPKLIEQGREHWIKEEMAILTDPNTYHIEPSEAYKRLKTRNAKPKFLAILSEISAVRETLSQTKNITRRRILKDETLLDIAGTAPINVEELGGIRGLPNKFEFSHNGKLILDAVKKGLNTRKEDMPKPEYRPALTEAEHAVLDLLKALLKDCADSVGIAPRIMANTQDLTNIARGDLDKVLAMKGWRKKLFGTRALKLKDGKIALAIKDSKLVFIDLP